MKKNTYYSSSLFLATFLIYMSSCTSTTRLEVLQPAQMVIPQHINVIATVDRSKPEKGWANILEGILTGEDIAQDKRGREQALQGLTTILTRTPRFTVRHTGIAYTASKSGGRMMPPLPWHEIEEICRQYDADGVVTIEKFDSDNSTNTVQKERKSKDKNGKETITTYFESSLDLTVTLGWRFYDPKSRVILDEYSVRRNGSDNAEGKTKDDARRNLYNQTHLVEDISFGTGEDYGRRIAPIWVGVNRQFYKTAKGADKANMEKAARYVKANDWNSAAQLWRHLVTNAVEDKTAGKASLNMAVAAERESHLAKALEWAQKSYINHNNKKAKSYIRILEQRIRDEKRLAEQMK